MIRTMEIKSILIKDTTKEERIRIVQEGLSQCGWACDFCNGCDNLGGGWFYVKMGVSQSLCKPPN